MNFLKVFILLFASLFISACSYKAPEKELSKQTSITKLPQHKAPLLDHLSKTDKKLANHSAFYSLSNPADALAARLFLVDHATTSLDVQYYIYKADTVGKVFTAHLLMAAQRGVKVRIIMDLSLIHI